MGQHKNNPNCKLAKEGKLPPKTKNLGAAERQAIVQAAMTEGVMLAMMGKLPKSKRKGDNKYDT